jgi:transcriptional regulator with XRE-family HTH domain
MQESLGHKLRLMRAERGLSLREAARRAGVVKETISDIERGHTHPYDVTLAKLAKVYDIPLEELLEEPALAGKAEAPDTGLTGQAEAAKSPASDTPEEEQVAEPLSPKQRRFAASARIATLERTFQHLTLRIETLRNQGKKYLEAGDRTGLWTVFMDYVLLARGANFLLADIREEAKELGGETKKERHLRDRLEHRTEDLEDLGDQIKNMREELLFAEREAEREAPLKEIHPETEPTDYDKVSYISQRHRAG